MEKGFKRKLKLLIASEEYEKYKEIPPKDNTRRCKPLVPPQSFESPHVYRKDSILNKFKCKDCHQEFTPEENAIKHMNDDKLRTNAWLEKLGDKMKNDKRLADFYESPANIKHLSVLNNLAHPKFSINKNDDNDTHAKEVGLEPLDPQEVLRKQLHIEQTKVRRLSGELLKEKSRHMEEKENNVQKTIRSEVKRIDPEEETIKIVSKNGPLLTIKTTKNIQEKNTGRKRTQSQTLTLVNISSRGAYKQSDQTEAGPSHMSQTTLLRKSRTVLEVATKITTSSVEAAIVQAKVIDIQTENKDFEETFKGQSKTFKERNDLTVSEAATIHLATDENRRSYRKKITALNKLGKNNLPPEKKVVEELKSQTTINSDDYKQDTKLIHKTKQGDKAAITEETAVTMIKTFNMFLKKVIRAEYEHLEDKTTLNVAICVDAGGKRVVGELVLLN